MSFVMRCCSIGARPASLHEVAITKFVGSNELGPTTTAAMQRMRARDATGLGAFMCELFTSLAQHGPFSYIFFESL